MPDTDTNGEIPLVVHLAELRKRLVICCIAVMAGTLICFRYSERLFDLLAQPLIYALPSANKSLAFIGVIDPFFTYLKISILGGIILSSPIILYEIWSFIAPGLYSRERIWFWPVVAVSTLLFVAGVFFGYEIVFPYGFKYLLGYANPRLQPVLSMTIYFSFAVNLLIVFGIVFELPLFMSVFARLGLADAKGFARYRKYAVIGAVVFGAVLTPPDALSQIMMAGPIIILYEIGIICSRLIGKKRETEQP